MKILLLAYRCEPGKGSEPGVGWNWALQIARFHDVWVLTREANRQAIEGYMSSNPVPQLRFVYYDTPTWERRFTLGVHQLHYMAWQWGALRIARQLHDEEQFDVCHHVTYASHRFPSALAWLDVPLVWGPVGGGERAPLAFYQGMGWRGLAKEVLRDLHNAWVKVDPLVRHTRRRASLLLATSPETAHAITGREPSRVRVVPTIGVERRVGTLPTLGDGLKILFVGNLLYWKGGTIAIQAFHKFKLRHPRATLTLVGEGPDRSRLERLVNRRGLKDSVMFVGKLSRAATLDQYQDHDIFLYPSLHDSGAMVILEAMAVGLPIVCLDLGGPSVSVTSDCGIKVPAHSPKQAIEDLAIALCRLSEDETLRRDMGRCGRERAVQEFDWDHKGEALAGMYDSILRTSTKSIVATERT